MTPAARKASTDSILAECFAVMGTKEVDYASREDTMANFKRNAERAGLTKYQIWLVYFGKHCDAIFNAVKYHPANPCTATASEPLRTRVVDAINYLTILQNLSDEDGADAEARLVQIFGTETEHEAIAADYLPAFADDFQRVV